jgi:hypothetical protein
MHPLLQSALDEIDSATRGMTADQLDFHPEGKWSAAQVLEHLAMTFELTAQGAERCLAAGKNLASSPTFKQRMMQFVVIDLKRFPQGRKSPERVAPQGHTKGLEAVQRIRKALITMDERLAECEAKLPAGGCLMDHPVLGPLTQRGWRTFHYVHTRHHMVQVRALRERAARGASA